MTEPEPMEEDTKIDYTEDFKSLVLEASLSNSLTETAERFKVPPEMLSEWQRQEGIDCVLDPSLSVTLTPAASTSAITPSTSSSIPVPTFKAESVKVKSEAGGELAQTTPVNRVYTKEVINQVLNYLEVITRGVYFVGVFLYLPQFFLKHSTIKKICPSGKTFFNPVPFMSLIGHALLARRFGDFLS